MQRWLLIAAGVACTPVEDTNTDSSVGINDTGSMVADTSTETGPEATSQDSTEDSGSSGEPGCVGENVPAAVTEVAGCGAPIGASFCAEGRNHVEIGTEIDWMSNPPHSGPHFPMWETWGEHDSTIERGYWVHNMEHGGVVFAYLCPGDCETDLEVLRQVIAMRPEARILVTPDPKLTESRFAAVSWTWVHNFETADLDELLCFVDQHFNHAPEDVP